MACLSEIFFCTTLTDWSYDNQAGEWTIWIENDGSKASQKPLEQNLKHFWMPDVFSANLELGEDVRFIPRISSWKRLRNNLLGRANFLGPATLLSHHGLIPMLTGYPQVYLAKKYNIPPVGTIAQCVPILLESLTPNLLTPNSEWFMGVGNNLDLACSSSHVPRLLPSEDMRMPTLSPWIFGKQYTLMSSLWHLQTHFQLVHSSSYASNSTLPINLIFHYRSLWEILIVLDAGRACDKIPETHSHLLYRQRRPMKRWG